MKWLKTKIVFKIIFALFLSAASAEQAENQLQRLASANNNFSFNLFRNLQRQTDKNIFISPFSIHTALAMVIEGARGKTAEEIQHALSYDAVEVQSNNLSKDFKELLSLLQREDEYQLKIANAMVTQTNFPIMKEFLLKMKNDFYALIKDVDFETDKIDAKREINDWVNQATNGKITTLLKTLDDYTKMVLLNAVFFKGIWEIPFNKSRTRNETFYNNNVTPVQVPTMIIETDEFKYIRMKREGFHAVSLPYKGNDIEMIIILPLQKFTLNDILLDSEKLDEAISSMSEIKMFLTLPKFTLEDSHTLNDHLKSLGMKNAFTRNANFSGINNDSGLYISKVVHKAVIEVNEQGSIAASSTGVVAITRIGPFAFLCERPFLFIIRDTRTNMNLFMGQINQL